jgi:rhamnosyltransferase
MENDFVVNFPRVAVLLAAYEGETNIGEQLRSILLQIDVNISVIVSVDPSLDATAILVDEFARSDTRVRMLPSTMPSGGAGQNFFRLFRDVDFRDFDFIALSDQDDIWFQDKL